MRSIIKWLLIVICFLIHMFVNASSSFILYESQTQTIAYLESYNQLSKIEKEGQKEIAAIKIFWLRGTFDSSWRLLTNPMWIKGTSKKVRDEMIQNIDRTIKLYIKNPDWIGNWTSDIHSEDVNPFTEFTLDHHSVDILFKIRISVEKNLSPQDKMFIFIKYLHHAILAGGRINGFRYFEQFRFLSSEFLKDFGSIPEEKDRIDKVKTMRQKVADILPRSELF